MKVWLDSSCVLLQARRLLGTTSWKRAACAQDSSMLCWQPQIAQMRSLGSDVGERNPRVLKVCVDIQIEVVCTACFTSHQCLGASASLGLSGRCMAACGMYLTC